MKKIFSDKIINIDENYFDNQFLFEIPLRLEYENEIDLSILLREKENKNLHYKKDYKLWSEVFSPKDELRIFEELVEKTLKNWKKVHISNISLAEEVEIIKNLYLNLDYFNKELNYFEVDFANAPVTIGVNINNLIYSFKDYKSQRDKILFVPPPREPRHIKAINAGINSRTISTIWLNWKEEELSVLKNLVLQEKINLIQLGNCIYYNYKKIWFNLENKEIIIKL